MVGLPPEIFIFCAEALWRRTYSMPEDYKIKTRKIKMRSYRKTRQLLFVFGTAGLALGGGLVAFFMLKRNILLVNIGLIYILTAMLLLGIRGVLGYLDDINKRRRCEATARRTPPS